MLPVLIVTGPPGAGKTSVAGEVSDRLAERGVAHAMVDLDGLRTAYPAPAHDPFNEELGLANLRDVWRNFAAHGCERLVIATVIEDRVDLRRFQAALPDPHIVVCRLRVSPATMADRLKRRETGSSLDWHVRRAAELAAHYERHEVGDIVVDAHRPLTEVAARVLADTGWANVSTDSPTAHR